MTNSATTTDFKVSWRYFKENWKTFMGFSLFVFASYFFLVIFLALFFTFLFMVALNGPELLLENERYLAVITLLTAMPGFVYMTAFMGALFGYAYDIMSSGDEFTEFKNVFMYFREYWLKYVILSLIANLPMFSLFILQSNRIQNTIWGYMLVVGVYLLALFWNNLFMLTFPGVTAGNPLKQSIFDNWSLLKNDFVRILKTLWLSSLIFSLPGILLASFFIVFSSSIPDDRGSIVLALSALLTFFSSLIGNPFLALICTRIYNTNFSESSKKKKEIGLNHLF